MIDQAVPLATRKGRPIRNEQPLPKAPAEIRKETQWITERIREWHELRRPATQEPQTYNCMGLVFGSRRTCIDPEEFQLVSEDDGIRELKPGEVARCGDVVAYYSRESLTHVGIILKLPVIRNAADEQDFIILSKWGLLGEYTHQLWAIPAAFGDRTDGYKVWTDRP